MEKRETSYAVGENGTWCSPCVQNIRKSHRGGSSKYEKIDLPYDPAISLLCIYEKKTRALTWKDICTLTLVASLFIMAKIWKQPKYPSTHEWKKKCLTHTHWKIKILFSHKQIQPQTLATCDNRDAPREYYAKWNTSDGERQIPYDFTYMQNLTPPWMPPKPPP